MSGGCFPKNKRHGRKLQRLLRWGYAGSESKKPTANVAIGLYFFETALKVSEVRDGAGSGPETGLFVFFAFGFGRNRLVNDVQIVRSGGADVFEQLGDFEFSFSISFCGKFLNALA